MKILKTALYVLLIFIFSHTAFLQISAASQKSGDENIRITLLYDNYKHAPNTQVGFGFACLVEINSKMILFDTGSEPDILINNAKALNKDLKRVNIVVISHNHFDHTGSLLKVLDIADTLTLYLPQSFKDTYDARKAIETGSQVVFVKASTQISENCYSTGELGGDIKEQSLILDSKYGLVVIAGCAHPGITNIIKTAKEILEKEVYLVMGGFHLVEHPLGFQQEIVSEVKSLGVKKCGPSHCSGNLESFKQTFGSNYIKMDTGQVVEIKGH